MEVPMQVPSGSQQRFDSLTGPAQFWRVADGRDYANRIGGGSQATNDNAFRLDDQQMTGISNAEMIIVQAQKAVPI